MEAVSYLTRQHRELEELLEKAVECQDPAKRREIFSRAADHLALHLESEEQVLYPAVKSSGTQDILLESLEEHLSLKRLMTDLMELDPAAQTYEPKLKVLKEQSEHHHGEEEDDLFPKIEKLLSLERRTELAKEMDALQQRMNAQKAPRENVKGETDAAAPL